MAFSLTATIRAFVAPNHRLRCSSRLWRRIIAELERRGENRHEAGAFLLGVSDGARKEVREAVYYDQLDPRAYDSGVCVLHGDAFALLWSLCREKNLTVVADVHTHPDAAFQSDADRTNPMVAREGHIAIIVPNFARWPIKSSALGVYEYIGDHAWHSRGGRHAAQNLYRGFWA
jgi:proteasome lid subunit RPN8/RPN11